MSDKVPQRSISLIILGCAVFAIIGLIVSAYWTFLFPHLIFLPATTTQPVGVGDEYNALGAMFTLLAFVGLIGALLLQRKDLELQGQSLEFQRKDSEQHKKELAEQQKYLEDQRKEAAKDQVRREVFQLMDAWQEVVHHTAYKVEADGRLAFTVMSKNLRAKLQEFRNGQPLSRQHFQVAYKEFYQGKYMHALGHYFRLLYHILRYINRNNAILDWKERKQLARLIRAHLSEPEFHLLFWNGLSMHGEKMFRLIEKYDMLQNYSFNAEDVREEEIKFYPKTYERVNERRKRDARKLSSA